MNLLMYREKADVKAHHTLNTYPFLKLPLPNKRRAIADRGIRG